MGPSGSASVATDEAAMAPDLDDMAGYEDTANGESVNKANRDHKFEAWLAVGDTPGSLGKLQHKSTILRFCSNPLTVAVSEDRLKRVCGFSKYNEPTVHSANFNLDAAEDADSMLAVEDLAVTLVCCNGLIFLAVIRMLDLRVDSAYVESLPARILHEPNVRAHGQIMCLVLSDGSHQPDGPDWQ